MFCAGKLPLGRRAALVSFLLTLMATLPAGAHDAPKGWTYPFACCSGYDCREIASKAISERPEGYVIQGTGEVVTYNDKRIRLSPDGEFHWCSVAGANDGRTICLFVPPRSY
jgi:hypothetical protein